MLYIFSIIPHAYKPKLHAPSGSGNIAPYAYELIFAATYTFAAQSKHVRDNDI